MRLLPLLALLISLSAFAQQPSAKPARRPQTGPATNPPANAATREQLAKLFDLMGTKQQVNNITDMLRKNMASMMESQMPNLSDEQRAKLGKLDSELYQKLMTPEFVSGLLEQMVPAYQQHFTRSDADELIRFYSSPVGKKLVRVQPEIADRYMPGIMATTHARATAIMQEMHFEERMRDIFMEGEQPAATPQSPEPPAKLKTAKPPAEERR